MVATFIFWWYRPSPLSTALTIVEVCRSPWLEWLVVVGVKVGLGALVLPRPVHQLLNPRHDACYKAGWSGCRDSHLACPKARAWFAFHGASGIHEYIQYTLSISMISAKLLVTDSRVISNIRTFRLALNNVVIYYFVTWVHSHTYLYTQTYSEVQLSYDVEQLTHSKRIQNIFQTIYFL